MRECVCCCIEDLTEALSRRQRSEQYFTSSQTFSHFLRQTKGREQTGHSFCGKCALVCMKHYTQLSTTRTRLAILWVGMGNTP